MAASLARSSYRTTDSNVAGRGGDRYIPLMKKLSRRRFLGATAGAAVGIASLPAAAVASGQATPAGGQAAAILPDTTLVLTNGRIHTMDARNTIARTVSIRNGRFVAVGDANPARGTNTRIIDLKGRTVVPGIIEGHVHIVSLANRPGYHTILENTTSIREIQEALAARRKDVPQGAWITSMGAGTRTSGPSTAIRHVRSSTRPSPIGQCCSTSVSPAPA
jgi:Amidohydrolase family